MALTRTVLYGPASADLLENTNILETGYSCSICGFNTTLAQDDALPSSCPDCGAAATDEDGS